MTDTGEYRATYGLALETSSAHGAVALAHGERVIETRRLSAPRRHAVEFLPTIDALCKAHGVGPADVGVVYVSTGPGSFTGLRIGITVARMIAFASRAGFQAEGRGEPPPAATCRIVAVPTLEVIAQNALEAPAPPDRVVGLLDAKRGRVYACTFVRGEGRYHAAGQPVEADPASFLAEQAGVGVTCAVLGEGVTYHRAVVESSGLRVLPAELYAPRAETVCRLGVTRATAGMFTDARMLIPTYIRPPEAEEKWQEAHRC